MWDTNVEETNKAGKGGRERRRVGENHIMHCIFLSYCQQINSLINKEVMKKDYMAKFLSKNSSFPSLI